MVSLVHARPRSRLRRRRCRPKSDLPRFASAGPGLRYYSPNLGRWTRRDPIEENGGENLYGFCGTAAGVNAVDFLGQVAITITKSGITKGKCGWFQTTVSFNIGGGAGTIGHWIIQHTKKKVVITEKGELVISLDPETGKYTCKCENCKEVNITAVDRDFYEAFQIQADPLTGKAINKVDISSGHHGGRCRSGKQDTSKVAAYYGAMATNDQGCPVGFTKGGSIDPTDGGGCWKSNPPSGWGGKPSVSYGIESTWDCCPVESDTEVDWK